MTVKAIALGFASGDGGDGAIGPVGDSRTSR
jgi:hypothetical protein